jgi:hypothetical protein
MAGRQASRITISEHPPGTDKEKQKREEEKNFTHFEIHLSYDTAKSPSIFIVFIR